MGHRRGRHTAADKIAAWKEKYEHISLAAAAAQFGFVPMDTQLLHDGASALLEEQAEEGKCQTALLPSEASQHTIDEVRRAIGERTDSRLHLRILRDPTHPCNRLRREHPLSIGAKVGREAAVGVFTRPVLDEPITRGTLLMEYAGEVVDTGTFLDNTRAFDCRDDQVDKASQEYVMRSERAVVAHPTPNCIERSVGSVLVHTREAPLHMHRYATALRRLATACFPKTLWGGESFAPLACHPSCLHMQMLIHRWA